MQSIDNIPWVEKYRPTTFDNIVLDKMNRQVFENILKNKYFPNLLFYGPPGTGKTTSIINIINEYNKRYTKNSKGSVIHLNASDERGIDIIRNQILQFVKTNNFFENCIKFVILDEVDYMTKNAQQALKYLLQSCNYNVRFCLICNYISKIDESLKNEFICIRFNQLPRKDTGDFIRNICKNEQINVNDAQINQLLEVYNSDIRSMINYIQLNKDSTANYDYVLSNGILERIHTYLLENIDKKTIITYIHDISIQHNTDKKSILKKYLNYVIRTYPKMVSSEFLTVVGNVLHINELNIQNAMKYLILKLQQLYSTKIDS
jgi:DNA polymerase III delta prime subunit